MVRLARISLQRLALLLHLLKQGVGSDSVVLGGWEAFVKLGDKSWNKKTLWSAPIHIDLNQQSHGIRDGYTAQIVYRILLFDLSLPSCIASRTPGMLGNRLRP